MVDDDDAGVLLLVDLATLVPRIQTQADMSDALQLLDDLCGADFVARSANDTVRDVDVRFYGGFFAANGTATAQYTLLLRALRSFGGLRDGLRIRPAVATAIAAAPAARIIGTYRGGKQRMVDQMLAQDALVLAEQYSDLCLVADDEDYFPAILALLARTPARVRWMRQRPTGRNDQHFDGRRITLLSSSAWI